VPLSIVFPASLEPETEHVNTADDINTTENKGRPKTAVNKKRKLNSPAMNTRAKVSTTPDSPAMGTRIKRKLDISCCLWDDSKLQIFCNSCGLSIDHNLHFVRPKQWPVHDQNNGLVYVMTKTMVWSTGL